MLIVFMSWIIEQVVEKIIHEELLDNSKGIYAGRWLVQTGVKNLARNLKISNPATFN